MTKSGRSLRVIRCASGDEQVARCFGAQLSFPNGTGILGRLSLLDRAESRSLAESAARAGGAEARRPCPIVPLFV